MADPLSDAALRLYAEAPAGMRPLAGDVESMARELLRTRAVVEAFDSIAWMAEAYAEAGGSSGPEMRSYTEAMEARAALDAEEVPRD